MQPKFHSVFSELYLRYDVVIFPCDVLEYKSLASPDGVLCMWLVVPLGLDHMI